MAQRAWLEQMLRDAFSFVYAAPLPGSVSTYARLPSTSFILAHNTSGKLAHHVMGTNHKSQIRAAKMPETYLGLAFTSDPHQRHSLWRFKGGARNGVYAHQLEFMRRAYTHCSPMAAGSLNLSEIAGLLDEHA